MQWQLFVLPVYSLVWMTMISIIMWKAFPMPVSYTHLPQEKIPKLFVDSEKIAWVLTNLLSNAIRYSKENGRVVIGVRHKKEYIELYVQDFGKGIDPRYHQSIFDRYFRVPGTKVQGSGLGLSISKDFVEEHGGTLTVQSEPGKGSCFVIRLKAVSYTHLPILLKQ